MTSRHTCCNKEKVKRGLWSPEEDEKLINYISTFGHGCWSTVPKLAGLQRCGKSCRLRWINYLRPDLKRGNFTPQEAALIVELHRLLGNRWAQIAKHLPGRTDNEVKNFWNSSIKKQILPHHNMSRNSLNLIQNPQIAQNPTFLGFGESRAGHPIQNPQIEQNPTFLGFDESRTDHVDVMNYGSNSQNSSFSDYQSLPLSNPPFFDQIQNQSLKQEDSFVFSSGPDLLIPKQENVVTYHHQHSIFLDNSKAEFAEMVEGFKFGISNSRLMMEEQLDSGPDSGFGPIYPNHIKNISCLMASFAAPPPPTAAALPPLPGCFGMKVTPSRWGPQNYD